MRAFLNEDIIIQLHANGDIEIGTIPKGVGLERLRWDGNKLIDLNDLTEIWVRKVGDRFELHCMEVANSQLVKMTYAERKYLKANNEIRLKTAEEIEIENKEKIILTAKTALSNKLGNRIDRELAQLAFTCALIVYARQQPQQLGTFFDSLIPDIISIFPLDRWQELLTKFAKDLKQFMTEYYTRIDST